MAPWLRGGAKLVAVIVLVIGGAFGIYGWVNCAVSLDHARQEQEMQRRKTRVLQRLLYEAGSHLNRAALTRLVREKFQKTHVVKEEHDLLLVDEIVLRFERDVLVEVQLLDQPTQ